MKSEIHRVGDGFFVLKLSRILLPVYDDPCSPYRTVAGFGNPCGPLRLAFFQFVHIVPVRVDVSLD